MNLTMEEAFAEACQALGEALVRERVLSREMGRLTKERDDLLHMADHAPDPADT